MEQVLYPLPNGWQWYKLKNLTTKIGSGATPKGGEKSYKPSGISLIRSLNVHDCFFKDENLAFIDDKQANSLKNVVVESGDVLLNITGASIARCCIVPDEFLPARVNQHVTIIRPTENVDSKFLNYLLVDPKFKAQLLWQGAGGATRQALTKKMVEELDIPLPNLPEQKRIAGKLDALLTHIATAIEHLQESVTLNNSLLQSALDGQFAAISERMKIESLAEVKGGKRLPKGEKLSDEVTDHPYIRVADFTEKGTIDLSGIKYISKEIHSQIKRYVISKHDLYISIAGTIGKTGFVPPELDGANLTENAAKLVIKDRQRLDLSYLYLFTLTSDFSAQAGLATKTVAQPKLALTRLGKIEIPMCSLKEQKSLVTTIETLKNKIHDAEEALLGKIEDLKSLNASILDSAFKGEL